MSTFSKLTAITRENNVPPLAIAQVAVAIAEKHGQDSGEPDMAIGDLEIMLAGALKRLAPEQRQAWVAEMSVELGLEDES